MDSRSSLNLSEDMTLAEEGLRTSIDNESFFNKANPLAVSTVGREQRNRQLKEDIGGGSFLDIESPDHKTPDPAKQKQLRLSFSACNQSGVSERGTTRDIVSSKSAPQLAPEMTDSTISVIGSWSGIQQYPKLDSEESRKSSLGILRMDEMSDLSSSMFHIEPQHAQNQPNQDSRNTWKNTLPDSGQFSRGGSTSNPSRGISYSNSSQGGGYSDSGNWQDGSKQDSKTDQPIGRSHIIDTVKKRPSMMPKETSSHPLLSAVCTSLAYGDPGAESEGDITVPDVQLLEDELIKLDDDFGDFDDLEQTCIDDVDEPVPDTRQIENLSNDKDTLDDIYLRPAVKHDGGDGAEGVNPYPSLSKVSLFEDGGSFEDVKTPERDKKQTNLMSQLARQNYRSDGSEIDTEDELEMARQAIGQSKQTREEAAGRSADVEHLVQISEPSVGGLRENGNGSGNDIQPSLMMRQSAEGEIVASLVPGDGGGGGDGSSGSDSDDMVPTSTGQTQQLTNQAQSFLSAFQQSFRPIQPPPSEVVDVEEQRVKPMGDDLLTEKDIHRYSGYQGNQSNDDNSLLQSRFLAPAPMLPPGEVTRAAQWGQGLSDSTLNVDELVNGNNPGSSDIRLDDKSEMFPGDRQEASGFNADDIFQSDRDDDNPFGMAESSFGSFGINPPSQSHDARFSNEGSVTSSQYQEPQFSPLSHRTSADSRNAGSPKMRVSSIPMGTRMPPEYSQGATPQMENKLQPVSLPENNEIDQIYKDDDGEYVTDLAFRMSFAKVAVEQQELLKAQGDQVLNSTVQDDNFFSSGEAQKMLFEDEKEFEKENVFRQDENMDPVETPETSWMYRSKMSLSCHSSMKGENDDDNDPSRISIGTFMMRRSGALGSLDGDTNIPRPDFGMKVKTPPENRKPMPLLDSPTKSNLSTVDEQTSKRTSGVGDEDGEETMVNDRLTLSCLEKTPKAQVSESNKVVTNSEPIMSLAGHDIGQDNVFSPDRTPSNASLAENSGVLNMSDISRLVATASAGARPSELSKMILALSNRGGSKRKQDSASQDKSDNQPHSTTKFEESQSIKITDLDKTSEESQKSRSSRLPVKKGSNIRRSDHRHPSDSDKADKKERNLNETGQGLITESSLNRTKPVKMHKGDRQEIDREMFPKSIPDGEESDSENNSRKKNANHASRSSSVKTDLNMPTNVLDENRKILDMSLEFGRPPDRVNTSRQTELQKKDQIKPVILSESSKDSLLSGQTITAKELSSALGKVHQTKDANNLARKFQKSQNSEIAENMYGHSSNGSLEKSYPFSRDTQPDGQATHFETSGKVSTKAVTQSMALQGKYVDIKIDDVRSYPTNDDKDLQPGIQVRCEKSPRSSVNSMGLTGHHIPDGTEYSFQTDQGHVDNRGMSREDLVGTDDIDTADSRGFDLISSGKRQNQMEPHLMANNHIPSHPRSSLNSEIPRHDDLVVKYQNEESNMVDKRAMSPYFSKTGESEKPEYHAEIANHERRYSSSPRSNEFHHGPFKTDLPNNQMPDELLMPPPPVPSFNHKLLPPKLKKTDPPLLLTKQSLLDTEFAREYLVRDAPGQVVAKTSKSYSQTLPDVEYGRAENLSMEPNTPGWQSQYLDSRLSMLSQGPSYQSTPFIRRDSTDGGKQIDNTILTQSTMHSMMSTGNFEEMIPSQSMTMSICEPSICKPVPKKLTPVKAPGELRFSEVCCLGITTKAVLPLTNPTDNWLECHLRIQMLSIDGQVVKNDAIFPFEIKDKVIIEPHKTEGIPVIFIPKVQGAYVAQLLIFSTLFLREGVEFEKIPTEVSIQAIAEKPNIKLMTKDHYTVDFRELDFGEMGWGTCRERCLSIINQGQAMVPIRLAISSRRPWHSFTFDPRNSGDVSIISLSSRPQSQALNRIVKTFCLPGIDKNERGRPHDIKIFCCPPQKQNDRALAKQSPCLMMAKVDIEVDTPSSHVPAIASLNLKSVIGVPKIHIDDQHLEAVLLQSIPGKKEKENVTIKNAGNISVCVHISILDDEGIFSVCPDTLHIPAGHQDFTCVEFLPVTGKLPFYETILCLSLQPDGPAYELPLRGEVRQQTHGSGKPLLLADKQFLLYGGVPVGDSLDKKVTLLNKSSYPLKLKLEIISNVADFQLKSKSYPDRLTKEREVIVQPAEKYPVYVQFCPSRVEEVGGRLRIKPEGTTFKYSIILSGYGGSSNLMLDGVSMSDRNKYWLNIGQVLAGQRTTKLVTVRNVGTRAAYVKAMGFTDAGCKNLMVANRFVVEPNEFILQDRETKTVSVVFNPTERESALCNENKDIVATMAFVYGDEVSRQKYRRSLRDAKVDLRSISNGDEVIKSINFNVPYIDENLVLQAPTGPTGISPNSYIERFYSTMSKVTVALVGEPPPRRSGSVSRTPPLHRGSQPMSRTSVLTNSISSQGHNQRIPVRDSNTNMEAVTMAATMPVLTGPLFAGQTADRDWIIKPDQIILNAPLKRDEKPHIAKFQITNLQNRQLQYELCWPGHWIKVTPELGVIEPKSSTTVCISPSAAVYQNLNILPWSGTVQVNCDHHYKLLNIQIRTDVSLDGSVQVSNKTLVPLYSQTSSNVGSFTGQTLDLSNATTNVTTSSSQVNFPVTKVGDRSETTFNLENPSSNDIRWIISSFAPPYVKGADSTNVVFRATYKVFEFSEKFGHLQPGKSVQLHIQFMPRSQGTFTQYWDIQSKSDAKTALSSTTTRIQLYGEGIQNKQEQVESIALQIPEAADVKDRYNATEKKSKPVALKVDYVDFPSCNVGQSHMCKIEFKNESTTSHVIEVISPQPPFYVKRTKFEINSRRYLKFPIYFKPDRVGKFEGILVFRVDLGYSLSLKMEAECKKVS